MQTDKTPVPSSIEYWPVDHVGKRARAVKHNEGLLVLCAGLHDINKGRNVGIKTDAQVLKVVNDYVDAVHVGGGRPAAVPIKRNKAQSRLLVSRGLHLLACRRSTPESVLWGEDKPQVHPAAKQTIHAVLRIG